MTGKEIKIKGPEGTFMGYLASPASGKGPAVVVIQEIFGVNAFVRETADWLAGQGFFALAPDLFWQIEPGVQLTDQSEAHWKRAFELFNAFNVDKGVKDIQAAIDVARTLPGVTGKVGAVGYCLGGLLAYLTAARTTSDGSVGYYGVTIDQRLDESKGIKKPLMLHIADKDGFVPPEAVEKIVAGLSSNPKVTLHRYPGVDHGFARIHGQHYDKAAAELANSRTLEFFRKNLA